ncbi:MAG: glycosyltransferase family 4 protein [Alphaproteobacteria bacterium]|nr:glycosyltransferase family 4 protein [Alphaproteobacteria bacterium]
MATLAPLLPRQRIAFVPDPAELPEAVVAFAPGTPLRLVWFGLSGPHRVALDRLIQRDLPRLGRLQPFELAIVSDAVPPGAAGASIRLVRWSVEALARSLTRTDIVILPVDLESPLDRLKSGNRMVQALRAGRLVVAHKLPAYLDLAAYGWVGDDLVEGIAWALANPGAARGRIAAGQTFVRDHATPAAIADAWLLVLDGLARRAADRLIGQGRDF